MRRADSAVDPVSPIAEPGSRLAAVAIDALVPAIPELVLLPLGLFLRAPALVHLGTHLGWAAIAIVFLVDLVLLHRFGQTIGKRVMRLRIVREDGTRAGLARLVLLRTLVPAVVGVVPFFGWAFALADTLAIFSRDRRTIHDHLAGTIVVDLRAEAARSRAQ